MCQSHLLNSPASQVAVLSNQASQPLHLICISCSSWRRCLYVIAVSRWPSPSVLLLISRFERQSSSQYGNPAGYLPLEAASPSTYPPIPLESAPQSRTKVMLSPKTTSWTPVDEGGGIMKHLPRHRRMTGLRLAPLTTRPRNCPFDLLSP